MTYCLAMRMQAGLVFGSDTRTNAGVDYVTSYNKMHCFAPADDRVFVILAAGNLATTQEVLYCIQRDLDQGAAENLRTVGYLFEAAAYLGRLSQKVQGTHRQALNGIDGSATFILGGQLRGHAHEIFMIYPQGNYIHSSEETPYLQIGESKYGKPMLDRILTVNTSLDDGAKLALVSLDATIRSNVTVGMPFDIAIYPADSLVTPQRQEITRESMYYTSFQDHWQKGLCQTFSSLPAMAWPTPA